MLYARMKFLVTIGIIFLCNKLVAQRIYNANLLDTLQQISKTNTPAKYFAKLYYNAIAITNVYAATKPDSVRAFIFGFESVFAPTFFKSYRDFIAHKPQVFAWQRYYADTSLNELQYQFMGMNAHINGDMWLALKDKYSYDTLKKYRQSLLQFQKTLNVFFDSIYISSKGYKKIKWLHLLTLGTDRIIGRRLILHWRKRQGQMALLFYSAPKKCVRKQTYLKKRMIHYDQFAVNWIH
jgi:hypothetical protein